MRNKSVVMLLVLAMFIGFSLQVQASFSGVGPIDPSTGFPVWYQDTDGLALTLCLDQNGLCILPPAFDPAVTVPPLTIVYPTSFPDESFYFLADSVMNNLGPAGNAKLVLRLALEGAFGSIDGLPLPGAEMTFLRINFKKTGGLVPNSTYTITHPFGTFHVTTDEFGDTNILIAGQAYRIEEGCLGVPCDFTLLLPAPWTNMGPFLTAVFPAPPAGYIGDPNIEQTVTGGTNGNVFRVDGPDIGGPGVNTVSTDKFFLMGKLFDGVLPTPLTIEASNYARTTSGHIYVYATSSPTASLTVSGTNISTTPMVGNGTGKFFGHIDVANSLNIPPDVSVTADGLPATGISALSSSLRDIVTITKADYTLSTKTLNISAVSSDAVTPPILTLVGYGPLVGGKLTATGVLVPPSLATVVSSAGGADSATLTILETPAPSVSETLVVTTSVYRKLTKAWQVKGTSSVVKPTNTITVHYGPDLSGPVIGMATVALNGQWTLNVANSTIIAATGATISIESSNGSMLLAIPVKITN